MVESKCYRGYYITHNLYGKNEFTVDVDGDDVWCPTFEAAKKTIDEIVENAE